MDQAFSYDHYIDLERVPADAFDEPDRWVFLRALYEAGVEIPERDVGFLPYRIIELHQRLVIQFRLWRESSGREREWIEDRVINDAGTMGHYVTDASQPHHTTIHFNGWDADTPNPNGYTTTRDFHARFETVFVGAHVTFEDLLREMPSESPAAIQDVRARPAEQRSCVVAAEERRCQVDDIAVDEVVAVELRRHDRGVRAPEEPVLRGREAAVQNHAPILTRVGGARTTLPALSNRNW